MGNIGDAFASLLIVFIFISPLALWKLVDIVIWIYHHIYIGLK